MSPGTTRFLLLMRDGGYNAGNKSPGHKYMYDPCIRRYTVNRLPFPSHP